MKKLILTITLVLFITLLSSAQSLSPYYYCGSIKGNISSVYDATKSALLSKDFKIIGTYHPEGKSNYKLIAYTRKDLYNYVLKSKNRGGLAAVLRIGLRETNGQVELTMLNPEYIFNAYLQENIEPMATQLKNISNQAKIAMKKLGGELKPFGGSIDIKDLRKYKYMMGMQDFNDPVVLRTFSSFDEGVEIIKNNLQNKVGNTAKVYSLVFPTSKVAVFGIALNDKEHGEAHFLPIIGEKHICAMPYEIILQGKEASMLHGRYRIALNWPLLSMKTFTKIMTTPGQIENTLKKVVDN